mmetsp:Transcript_4167/g.17687  ORF Transcript_4167/g.17687 Transcript_4167/m.17687 type:complete len:262 (-) Transcript_4167:727-1512(-)
MAAPRFSPMPFSPPIRPHGDAAGSDPSSTFDRDTSAPRTTEDGALDGAFLGATEPPANAAGGCRSKSPSSSSSVRRVTVNAHPPSPSCTSAPSVNSYCRPGLICLPPTNVPLADPRSSMYTAPPTRNSAACALSTPATLVRMTSASPFRRPEPTRTGTPGSRSTAGPDQPTGAKTTRSSDANFTGVIAGLFSLEEKTSVGSKTDVGLGSRSSGSDATTETTSTSSSSTSIVASASVTKAAFSAFSSVAFSSVKIVRGSGFF